MDKKEFLLAVQKARDASPERKFKQSVECIVNFKNIDFKKAENRIDVTTALPYATGKGQAKTALFVHDANFAAMSKDKVSRIILEDEISKMDKKTANSLAEEFDAFFAEGPAMLTVAKFLGQVLAPKGKMPKPVPPEIGALEQALRSMKSGIRLSNKKGKFMPLVQCLIGKETMPDEELAENALTVYQSLSGAVSNPEYNIKNVFLKFTMGAPVKVGERSEKSEARKEKADKVKTAFAQAAPPTNKAKHEKSESSKTESKKARTPSPMKEKASGKRSDSA